MNIKTTIRKATPDDLSAIEALWKEFMDFHKERHPHFSRSADGHKKFSEFVDTHISSENSCVLVCESERDIVAYCLATIASNPPVFEETTYGALFDMAVSRSFRRQGIGERMYSKVHDWFKEKNMKRIEIRVALANEVSTAFWKKMGFTPYVETVTKEI